MFKKYLKLFNREEFSYKIYSEFDKDEWSLFLKCFKDIFREIEQNMFQWYFDKNNTFTILKNDKEKFIGIYGLLEIKLNFSGKEIESYLCHNVGIMEQYSGKGLFQYIGDKALSNRLNDKNLALGFPNKASRKGHLRLGWENIGNVHFISLIDKTYDINLDNQFNFVEIDNFKYIDTREFNKQFSLSLNKDVNYLNWRTSKPNTTYSKYLIKDSSTIIGYAIYKIFKDDIKKLHLVDYNFQNLTVLDEIIKFTMLKFKKSDCALVNTWITENTIYEKHFKSFGFIDDIQFPTYPIILFQSKNNFDISRLEKYKIFFTLFDNDVF